MARSTYQITVLLLWVALVREVLTQDQTLPDTANPSIQSMILGWYNEETENDANDMGRNAAEQMGALMASPPVKMFRLPQKDDQRQNGMTEYGGYSAREADWSSRSPCNRYDDAWSTYPDPEPSGRSATARTIPLGTLPPLPIIPGLSPVPLLSPLIQSLTNPSRLGLGYGAHPFLRTPLPYVPPLQTPYTPALRTPLPTYQLPRIKRVWIPPSTSRARSSFTPNSYAVSAKQDEPLIFYV